MKESLYNTEIIAKINPKIIAMIIEEVAKTIVFGNVWYIISETFLP